MLHNKFRLYAPVFNPPETAYVHNINKKKGSVASFEKKGCDRALEKDMKKDVTPPRTKRVS